MESRRRTKGPVVALLLGTLVAAVAVGVVVRAVLRPAAPPSPPAPTQTLAPAAPDLPVFAQPEEARRYLDAKENGYRRALEVLDQAIAEASRNPGVTPEHLAGLRQVRAQRAAALAAARDARMRP